MNAENMTPQELANTIAYHAEQMAIALRQYNKVEADLKALQNLDDDLIVHWPMDEQLNMAIAAFGIALENEPTDIQDALEAYL